MSKKERKRKPTGKEKESKRKGKETERKLNPRDVREWLRGIPSEHLIFIGMDKDNRPEWIVLKALPVPPITVPVIFIKLEGVFPPTIPLGAQQLIKDVLQITPKRVKLILKLYVKVKILKII